MAETKIYAISEITREIKRLLEDNFFSIWVEGEISNFIAHYSGHLYFTLKDENAQLSAVIWRSRAENLDFRLEDGQLVQAFGNIRLYEKSGRYQIDILRIQPAGLGQLQMEFERLKQKLEADGFFDPLHKKTLPAYPSKIGIVTSSTGAAIKDIINVLNRRAPNLEIILRPAKVQGAGAAEDIAEAIREFNEYKDIDLMIVGRGGGSLEDLWAFNEEVVARAIYDSKIPVISAVGHEIDFTIADFTADMRAPTPSAAAELAVPDYVELKENLVNAYRRMRQNVMSLIERHREAIRSIQRSYGMRRPEDLLKQYAYNVDELANKLRFNYKNLIQKQKTHLDHIRLRLENLSPKKVLERGYSISYIDGKIIRDIEEIKKNTAMITEISKGKIFSTIENTEKE